MKQIQTYSFILLSSVMLLLLSACGGDEAESTTLSPAAVSSYTGSAAAVHMELKRIDSRGNPVGRPVCKVHGTDAGAKPVIESCPNGEYIEQLFSASWGRIGTNKRVTVGPRNPGIGEAPLRNPNRAFYQYENGRSFENISSNRLNFSQLTSDDPDYDEIDYESNSTREPRFGAGNFRVTCQYSHFSYDDPILKPGEIDGAHLHMFFGKTNADYNTDENNIADSGGGTCNGFALNRSAYWVPALLDDRGKAVIPKTILVYYKSSRVHKREGVARMPHGLQLLGGNIKDSAKARVPSSESFDVFWSCGANGVKDEGATKLRKDLTKSGTLAELDGKCRDNEPINATIYFPQCVARDDSGAIKLKSDDDEPLSHTYRLRGVNDKCPGTHPVRIPELAILLYYQPQPSLEGWRLSSDMNGAAPGSTLHADWMGGWQDRTMDLWVENCNRARLNCTLGQTGTPDELKRAYNDESSVARHREICADTRDCRSDNWLGPYFVTPPARRR